MRLPSRWAFRRGRSSVSGALRGPGSSASWPKRKARRAMADTTQQRAAELFLAALDVEPDRRVTFLDEHCSGDAALRHEVETLFTADVQAERFMATSPEGVQSLAAVESDVLVGQTVGGYRIVRPLGSGGLGTVVE